MVFFVALHEGNAVVNPDWFVVRFQIRFDDVLFGTRAGKE